MRFILFKNPPFKEEGIWFHVASFGEAKSLKPLISRLSGVINISTVTQTGFKEVGNLTKYRRYLPYEIFLPFWITKQKALVVSEAELWYMLFWVAHKKRIKTYLINARISDRSYKNYLRFGWFYKRIFTNIDMVFAQSQKDKKRLQELGAKNITVNGNIKAIAQIEITKRYIKPSKNLITLASTHRGEEELILESLEIQDRKIMVAPRHPERFDEVDRYLQKYAKRRNLSYHRFSLDENFDSDIVLIDSLGELVNIYAISDIVILGGSFIDGIGGHNPLEAAYFECKIISGEYIFNQQALFSLIEGIKILKPCEISSVLIDLDNTKIIKSGDIELIIDELSVI